MIITTTPSIEGRSITDIVGGRSGAYESKLQDARDTAMHELEDRALALGADAVVGVDRGLRSGGQFHADGLGERHSGIAGLT